MRLRWGIPVTKKTLTKASTLLKGLKSDILWLLITIYAHRQRSQLPTISTMSREAFVLELVLLESATRDIIGRITALDDKQKGTRTFENTLAAMNREGLAPKRAQMLDKAVKDFRNKVSALKLEHRNSYIAHVKDLAVVDPRVLTAAPPDFAGGASSAVNLLDLMVGETVTYELKIGSMERVIDLRAALSTP